MGVLLVAGAPVVVAGQDRLVAAREVGVGLRVAGDRQHAILVAEVRPGDHYHAVFFVAGASVVVVVPKPKDCLVAKPKLRSGSAIASSAAAPQMASLRFIAIIDVGCRRLSGFVIKWTSWPGSRSQRIGRSCSRSGRRRRRSRNG